MDCVHELADLTLQPVAQLVDFIFVVALILLERVHFFEKDADPVVILLRPRNLKQIFEALKHLVLHSGRRIFVVSDHLVQLFYQDLIFPEVRVIPKGICELVEHLGELVINIRI